MEQIKTIILIKLSKSYFLPGILDEQIKYIDFYSMYLEKLHSRLLCIVHLVSEPIHKLII